MKLTIECLPEQAQLMINCLEECFRFRMGQSDLFLEHPLEELLGVKENMDLTIEVAEGVARGLVHVLYDGIEIPKEAPEIADMWRVLRHEMYIANEGVRMISSEI